MKKVSITINGITYDAVQSGKEKDCDECDLNHICMVSLWSIQQLCAELSGREFNVFKKSEKGGKS